MVYLLPLVQLGVHLRLNTSGAPHQIPIVALSDLKLIALKNSFHEAGISLVHFVQKFRLLIKEIVRFLVCQYFCTLSVDLLIRIYQKLLLFTY